MLKDKFSQLKNDARRDKLVFELTRNQFDFRIWCEASHKQAKN